jgi:uracil phosphoribosyltransferase
MAGHHCALSATAPYFDKTQCHFEQGDPHMTAALTVLDHPLIQHKLTLMRSVNTPTADFRQLLREISQLMAYEATRDLPVDNITIRTPIVEMQAPVIAGKKLCIVSILRAGNGILDGMLDVLPNARVGHIGLYRDPDTLIPVEYYNKMPNDLAERQVLCVDPMLATGHSAAAAVERLKQVGARDIKFLCLLAAPEGLETFQSAHPDVSVYVCCIDEGLNEKGYILPGIGDAGDRIYGTK